MNGENMHLGTMGFRVLESKYKGILGVYFLGLNGV